MKKMLSILSAVGFLSATGSSVVAMAPNNNVKAYKGVELNDLLPYEFEIENSWGTLNDTNVPEWALGKNNTNFSFTFGKEIKKDNWNQKEDSKISFSIDFTKLGGNYEKAKEMFDLNELVKTKIKIETQAGQPAHEKELGWKYEIKEINLLSLINDGSDIYHKNFLQKEWVNWAYFNSDLYTNWNKEKSLLTINYRIDNSYLRATKWTDGMYIKISLVNKDITISNK